MADYLAEASEEAVHAADYYEGRVQGLGVRFGAALRAAEARIDELPDAGAPVTWPGVPQGVRRVLLSDFPYAVIYTTDPAPTIVAVAHVKRRPGYWRDRLSPA